MTPYAPNAFRYIRAIRCDGTQAPLLCFLPGAPGARHLADHLPADLPIFEIYEPNMDGVAVFPTVEELAATFIEEVKALQPHGPYRLCGYSTFGLVAYEIARLLDAQQEKVALLAVFDIWHPTYRQRMGSREYIRYRLMRLADRSTKYAHLLTRGKVAEFAVTFRDFAIRRAKHVSWRLFRFLFRKANQPVPKTMQVIESVASHKAYDPLPYPGRLVIVRLKDLFEGLSNKAVGWDLCVTGGLDIHFVSGNHGTMMKPPHVAEVAATIAPYLVPACTEPVAQEPTLTAP